MKYVISNFPLFNKIFTEKYLGYLAVLETSLNSIWYVTPLLNLEVNSLALQFRTLPLELN
jgi:hypothetical protein